MNKPVLEPFDQICQEIESGIRDGRGLSFAMMIGDSNERHMTVGFDPDAPDGEVGPYLRELIVENKLDWSVIVRPYSRLSGSGVTSSIGVLFVSADGAVRCKVYDVDLNADYLYRICPARKGAEKDLLRWADGFLPAD